MFHEKQVQPSVAAQSSQQPAADEAFRLVSGCRSCPWYDISRSTASAEHLPCTFGLGVRRRRSCQRRGAQVNQQLHHAAAQLNPCMSRHAYAYTRHFKQVELSLTLSSSRACSRPIVQQTGMLAVGSSRDRAPPIARLRLRYACQRLATWVPSRDIAHWYTVIIPRYYQSIIQGLLESNAADRYAHS